MLPTDIFFVLNITPFVSAVTVLVTVSVPMNTGIPDTSIVVDEFPITNLLPQVNGDIDVVKLNLAIVLLNPVFESTN